MPKLVDINESDMKAAGLPSVGPRLVDINESDMRAAGLPIAKSSSKPSASPEPIRANHEATRPVDGTTKTPTELPISGKRPGGSIGPWAGPSIMERFDPSGERRDQLKKSTTRTGQLAAYGTAKAVSGTTLGVADVLTNLKGQDVSLAEYVNRLTGFMPSESDIKAGEVIEFATGISRAGGLIQPVIKRIAARTALKTILGGGLTFATRKSAEEMADKAISGKPIDWYGIHLEGGVGTLFGAGEAGIARFTGFLKALQSEKGIVKTGGVASRTPTTAKQEVLAAQKAWKETGDRSQWDAVVDKYTGRKPQATPAAQTTQSVPAIETPQGQASPATLGAGAGPRAELPAIVPPKQIVAPTPRQALPEGFRNIQPMEATPTATIPLLKGPENAMQGQEKGQSQAQTQVVQMGASPTQSRPMLTNETQAPSNLPPSQAEQDLDQGRSIEAGKAVEAWRKRVETPSQAEQGARAKEPWEMTKKDFIKDSDLSVVNNEKEGPKPNKYKDGDLVLDEYGENPYVYQMQYLDPSKIGFSLEGESRQRVINMPSTKKYIEWSKRGIEPSPITVVLQGDNKNPYSTNRRRVIAAQEAGVEKIPAFVEIGRHKDFIQQAHAEGKPISAKVLADYPDLAAKYQNRSVPTTEGASIAEAPMASTPSAPEPGNKGLVGITSLPVKDIKADPQRFQFKQEATGPSGVTEKLKSVEKWNTRAAGTILVWEKTDGQFFVVDGHHRLALAKKLGLPDINAVVVREADGVLAKDARVMGAMSNLADEKGTAIDAAKIFRESDISLAGLKAEGVDVRSDLVKQGLAMKNLSGEVFRMVIDKKVPANMAAKIGEFVQDPANQKKIADIISNGEIGTAREAELLAKTIDTAPAMEETSQTLFGRETVRRSLYAERAKILASIEGLLKTNKKVFSVLADKVGLIEGAGNVLAKDANLAAKQKADEILFVLEKMVNVKGPVSEALNAATIEYAKNATPANLGEVTKGLLAKWDRQLTVENVGKAGWGHN